MQAPKKQSSTMAKGPFESEKLTPRPQKDPKTVGSFIDVEGHPFVIKKIMTGGRLMIKELSVWPSEAEDWRANDKKKRDERAEFLRELRDDGFIYDRDDVCTISRKFVETILIPLLED